MLTVLMLLVRPPEGLVGEVGLAEFQEVLGDVGVAEVLEADVDLEGGVLVDRLVDLVLGGLGDLLGVEEVGEGQDDDAQLLAEGEVHVDDVEVEGLREELLLALVVDGLEGDFEGLVDEAGGEGRGELVEPLRGNGVFEIRDFEGQVAALGESQGEFPQLDERLEVEVSFVAGFRVRARVLHALGEIINRLN